MMRREVVWRFGPGRSGRRPRQLRFAHRLRNDTFRVRAARIDHQRVTGVMPGAVPAPHVYAASRHVERSVALLLARAQVLAHAECIAIVGLRREDRRDPRLSRGQVVFLQHRMGDLQILRYIRVRQVLVARDIAFRFGCWGDCAMRHSREGFSRPGDGGRRSGNSNSGGRRSRYWSRYWSRSRSRSRSRSSLPRLLCRDRTEYRFRSDIIHLATRPQDAVPRHCKNQQRHHQRHPNRHPARSARPFPGIIFRVKAVVLGPRLRIPCGGGGE